MRRVMFRIGVGGLFLVLLLLVGGAYAEAQSHLNGTYAFNQSRVCVNSAAGFDANLVLLGPAGTTSSLDAGTVTFDGVGGTTESGKTLTVNHNATGTSNTPASQSEFTSTGTYTVNADGTFTTSRNSAFMILTGPGAGQVGTVTGILAEGVILPGRRILISTVTTPTVETVSNTTLNTSFERICHRTSHFFAQ